ncbi:F-box/WD repeat-containing protein 4-like [Lucilia sericata]|uniref:F-box/WD repeat-containing protein 4-like n=1 Tax=Lucilia sericata TaxID=13632 RepID=UPI0018A86FCF|nr:F-box/WD repeat-containing protein 4-like [Lucilia sericata]
MQLLDLNTDCLLKIFNYCDEKDLINLSRAHRTLHNVIDNNIFHKLTLDLLMCGHRHQPDIIKRTHSYLSYANRLKIARNWLNGCYREQQYFHRSKMFATKLHLERNWLYVSYAGYLSQHKRLKAEALQRRYHQEITTSNRADIADFIKKNDSIFAGRVTGSCFIYEDGYAYEQQLHPPKEYLRCVDFAGQMYATSTDNFGKIWRREEELGLINLDLVKNLKHSYKTMRFNAAGDRLFGGLYTSTSRRALQEIDLESGCEQALNSNTISIYDLKLKDENTLFTANFDTSFRLYDRRSDRDEMIWEDPFDSSFFCLEYDGLYGVLCGTKYHSRVNLYDIRKPDKHMQLYFPQINRRRRANGGGEFKSSPVYSLACDCRYLFVATDHNVHVLDFKVDCAVSRDYRDIFRQMYRI